MLKLVRSTRTSYKALEVCPSTYPQQFFLVHDIILFLLRSSCPPQRKSSPYTFFPFLQRYSSLLRKNIVDLKMFLIYKHFPPLYSPFFLSFAKKDILLLQMFSIFLSPFFIHKISVIIFSMSKYYLLFPFHSFSPISKKIKISGSESRINQWTCLAIWCC